MSCLSPEDRHIVSLIHEIVDPIKHNIDQLMIRVGDERKTASDVLDVLQKLTDYAMNNHCLHEDTHRGGVLWTICDYCGRRWADDEGGMPPEAREYPKEIKDAIAVLSAVKD